VYWSVVVPVVLAVLVIVIRLRAAGRKLGDLLSEVDATRNPPADECRSPRPES
jgi:hypothetical protein